MKIKCTAEQKSLIIKSCQEINKNTLKYLDKLGIQTTTSFSHDSSTPSLYIQSIYENCNSKQSNDYTLFHGPVLGRSPKPWDFSSLSLSFQNVTIITYPGNGQTKIQPTTSDFLSLKIAETAKKILNGEKIEKDHFVGSSPITIRDFLKKTIPSNTSHTIEISLSLDSLQKIAPQINKGLLTKKTVDALFKEQKIYKENGPSIEEISQQFFQEKSVIDLCKNIFYFQQNEQELYWIIKLLQGAKQI